MTEPGDRARWDRLDETLAAVRGCRSVAEFAGCAGALAVRGCGAEAAAIGQVADGVWLPWLRSGELALLEAGGAIPSVPVPVQAAPSVEQQVIGCARPGVRDLPAESAGRQVVIAAIAGPDSVLGLLHVVARDPEVQLVECYADALGSMLGLLAVQRRVTEQRYVLARLRNGLATTGERPIELFDAAPDPRGARDTQARPNTSSAVLRARLTVRQREVLDLMVGGLSNAEIAERLVVALPTVKSHVRAVLRACGAVNRSDAVARFSRGRGTAPRQGVVDG